MGLSLHECELCCETVHTDDIREISFIKNETNLAVNEIVNKLNNKGVEKVNSTCFEVCSDCQEQFNVGYVISRNKTYKLEGLIDDIDFTEVPNLHLLLPTGFQFIFYKRTRTTFTV